MSIQSPTATNGSHSNVSGGDNYLVQLLQKCQKPVDTVDTHVTSLQEIRDRASSIIRQSTLPTTKNEEWRFTDLSPLKQIKFGVVETLHATSLQIANYCESHKVVLAQQIQLHQRFRGSGGWCQSRLASSRRCCSKDALLTWDLLN